MPFLQGAGLALGLMLPGCGGEEGGRPPAPAPPAEPLFERTAVFVGGIDGFPVYRIPCLVVAPDGHLLAIAEGRPSLSDAGTGGIVLVMRRSADLGRSWGPLEPLVDNGAGDVTNPTAVVVRRGRGRPARLWLFYTRWPAGTGESNVPAGTGPDSSGIHGRFSDDSGRSLSAERDLTAVVKDPAWHIASPGPGVGIQLRWPGGAAPAGRIVVPGWRTVGGGVDDGAKESFVFVSDDGGTTWARGGVTAGASDEAQLVQRTDGTLLLDARQADAAEPRRRVYTSGDGGRTWSPPAPGLAVTPVMTSLIRYSARRDGDDRDRLLFSGPRPGATRRGLRVLVSYDEGATWERETQIERGLSQYSVLARLPDGTVGLLFESGFSQAFPGTLTVEFARFNLAFLGERPGG